jgi:hypothetical protein
MELKDEYKPTDPNLKIAWNFADAMIMSLSLDNPITLPVNSNSKSQGDR